MNAVPGRYQGLVLGEAIQLFLTAKNGRKEATQRHYRDDLGRLAGFVGLDTALASITPEDLDRYLAHRRGEGIEEITVHHDYRAIKAFLNLAHRRRWIAENPIAAVDPPRVPKRHKPSLSDRQVARMMDACLTVRDLAIVALLVDTGIRAGELCRLQLSDVKVDKKQIHILGKGDKERLVPLSATVWNYIRAYLESDERPSELTDEDPLFASRIVGIRSGHSNLGLTVNGLKQLVQRLAKRAGIKGRVYTHLLRHTFGTRWCEKGGNTRILQEVMGHSDIRTTQEYAQPGIKAIIENHAELHILDDIAAEAKSLKRFKVLFDKPGGPKADILEAEHYEDAERRYGEDPFALGVLDVDEQDLEANVIQVADCLAIELYLDDHTLAFRIGDQPRFSVDVADALIAALKRIKTMVKDWTEREMDARPRSEELS